MALTTKKRAQQRSDTPYAGKLLEDQAEDDGTGRNRNAGRREGELALTAPHLLVAGGTGSGKTRSCLAQNVILWGSRPVIAMSSKGDLAELTIRQRAQRGPVYLLDISGEVRESELQGIDVTPVVSDPCALITTDDEALNMASLLLEVGKLAASSNGDSGGDSFWETLAMRPLAVFLRAAGWLPDPETGKPTWGGGINWALQAIEDVGSDTSDDDDTPVDMATPNWDTAYLRAKMMLGSRHAQSLKSAKKLDPKQRDSIGINCRVALTPWMLEAVAGDGSGTPFHPSMLEERGATLYIVAGSKGAAAPAATAVISQAVQHWRGRVGQLDPLLMVLDELPNNPLPELAQYVGEARGLGVRIVAGVQASSQFEKNWGSVGLKILRDIFPAVLIYPGVTEKELLDVAAWAKGEEERSVSSTDASGKASHAKDRVQVQTGADLIPPRPGTGRLLLGGMSGVLVRLPDLAATTLRTA